MKREDFLKALDVELDARNRSDERATKAQSNRAANTSLAVSQVLPVLERYKADLEDRGIAVDLDSSGQTLGFRIKYGLGGHHGFEIHDSGFQILTSENGKNYTAAGHGPTISEKGIDQAAFEKYVQDVISEFMNEAPKNGGHRQQ